ncbi:MAG: glutaredoxin [Bacteroidetes bacterium]|nr:MAG: glutaredoxin [Bacteroidota bacterium]
MHFNERELTLLYNARNSRDRQTLAYALTITSHVNKQEVSSVPISGTLFRILLDRFDGEPKSLLNKADPEYQRIHKGREYNPAVWIEAIKRRPELLRAPIAMYKGKVVLCDTPTAILKLANSNVGISA